MTSRDEIAARLCEHFAGGLSGDTPLRDIPRFQDPSFIAHFLNGPGADDVMNASDYRWLSVRSDDISQLVTLADLAELCRRHIVLPGA
jgi:hypothetical protein